jgi:hypothetical protein
MSISKIETAIEQSFENGTQQFHNSCVRSALVSRGLSLKSRG